MRYVDLRLVEYAEALVAARDAATRPEDRTACTKHLATVAEMFAALAQRQVSKLATLVADEERNLGWSYLAGEAGETVERAFQKVSRGVRELIASATKVCQERSTPEERLLRAIVGARPGDVLADPRPQFATLSLGVLPHGAVVDLQKISWDGRNGETTATFVISYERIDAPDGSG